jgi:hypothetical protein
MSKKRTQTTAELRSSKRMAFAKEDETVEDQVKWFSSKEFAGIQTVNATGHEVVLYADDDKTILRRFKTEMVAEIDEWKKTNVTERCYGFPIKPYMTARISMPSQHTDDILVCIVPREVGEYVQTTLHNYRGMVLGEDMSPESVVRGADGGILGVKRFVLYKADKMPDSHPQAKYICQ